MIGFHDRFQQARFTRTSEPFGVRFRRFLKTQPILALLLGQAIALYMYLQAGFFYSFLFVALLYFGGLFLRQFFNDMVLAGVYVLGAASGYIGYALMFDTPIAAPDTLHLAAAQGGAVFGLMSFISMAKPDLRIRMMLLLQIRYWHIAVVLMIFALLRKDLAGGGSHLAYLSGALTSALVAYFLVRLSASRWINKATAWRETRKKRRFARYTTVKEGGRPLRDEEYNDIKAERQKRIDEILDKISRSGYDSLTREEKELLFQQTNR
jgi:hypothetical protein